MTAKPQIILFVNGSTTIEGDTRVLINTVATLDPARYRAACITTPGPVERALRAIPGVVVSTASLGPGRALLPGSAGSVLAFLAATVAVLRATRAAKADIVYTYDRTRAAEAAFIAAKVLRRKLIFHAHYPLFLDQRRVRRFVAFHADRIIMISRYVAGMYADAGAPTGRVRVVLNGAETPSTSAGAGDGLRSRLGIPAGAPVIGMVGRLSPYKGQEELIRAAAILRESHPDLRVLICGRDTDESVWTHGPAATSYRAVLDAVCRELSMGDCIHLLGFASADELYEASDIVAAPSHAEPFGLVVIEGMLAGKPVVSTQAGGVPEIITDGETGVLVEPKNFASLARGMERLLADPALRSRIAAAGRIHAQTAFSIERYAHDFPTAIAVL
jgi:glycosyltransferase involved in cell wall biosynthesis